MRRLVLVLAAAALAPPPAAAKPPPPGYAALKLGGYFPIADDVASYDAGFAGELAVGYAPDPGFAFEGAVGLWQTSGRQGPAPRDLRVVPLTFAVRGTVTLKAFQPYALAGLGAYFVHDELAGASDDSTNVGLFLGIGGNASLGERLFVGLEGRYLWLKATTFGTGTHLDGATVTAHLGLRF